MNRYVASSLLLDGVILGVCLSAITIGVVSGDFVAVSIWMLAAFMWLVNLRYDWNRIPDQNS